MRQDVRNLIYFFKIAKQPIIGINSIASFQD